MTQNNLKSVNQDLSSSKTITVNLRQNASTSSNKTNTNIDAKKIGVMLPNMGDLHLENYLDQPKLRIGKAYLEQALSYFEEKQWLKAIAACQKTLAVCPNLAEAHKVWGNCLQRQGKVSEAFGEYAKALEINPDMAEVYANMGSLLAKKKKFKQALNYFQQAVNINSHSGAIYRNLARIWEEFGNRDKAEEYLFQAISLEPKALSAEQYFQLARELNLEGKQQKAISCYRYAIQLKPSFKEAYMNLVDILEANGRYQEANTYYRQVLALKPENSQEESSNSSGSRIRRLLAPEKTTKVRASLVESESASSFLLPPAVENNNKKSQIELAIDKYLSLAQQNPQSEKTQLKLGDLYAATKQWQEAINYYRQAISLNPNLAIAYHNLHKIYRKLGDNQQAITALYQAAVLEPEKITATEHLQLGNILLAQDEIKAARNCFSQAIKLQPKLEDAYLCLGKLLLQQGEKGKAISCYRQLVKQSPEFSEGYHLLADTLAKQEEWLEAIEAYKKAIKLSPERSWSYNNLGDVLLKLERWQAASKCYQKAISFNPKFVWSYQNLGDALFKQEKWQEALTAYTKTLKLRPDLPWTYYNLGDTLGKLLRWQEATIAYRQAIKLKPDFAEAYGHLGDALVREDQWQEAINSYEKAIEINPGIDITVYRNLKEALDRKKNLEQELTIKPTPIAVEKKKWPLIPIQRYQPPETLPNGNPWPKISIVTPSYNQGQFIEETILSIINQNYPNVEYILIDGASTDETMQIVNKYRQHFSHIISEPDQGQSEALNKGFSLATGTIYTWLNSDDRLAPGALYAAALAFHTSEADVVAGVCQIFKDGVEIEQHLTSCNDGTLSLDDILDLENCWLQGKFFYQPEVMFTSAIWKKAGGKVNESLFYSMDYEMWARFAERGAKLRVIGHPIAQYRMHEQQKTNTIEKYRPELLKTRDSLQQRFNLPVQVKSPELPTKERKSLKIVCLNDTGYFGGAGIAHQRIAQALALAGHQVLSVAGTLDWSLTPVDSTAEEVEEIINSIDPDLLVIGNIHNFQQPLEILEKLSSLYPTVFVMHDQWLFTGRCGYPGNCEAYTSLCDAECPTWDEYPRLAPTKIADAYRRKQALLQSNNQLLVLADSKWLTNWSRYAYINYASTKDYIQLNNRFQHLYYGLDLTVFQPQEQKNSRHQLGLPEDKFIILTGSQSLEDERKGFKYLLQALEIANIPDILLLCFGHDFHLETQLNIKSVGYIDNPSLLASYYSAADLFVSPALEEAFGQTFIEAAACGTPAVGFGVGGVKEAISNRASGRIVNQKTPQAMAKTLRELYEDRPQLELLSKLAPWYVANNFSLAASYHTMINAWENSGWLSDWGMAAVTKLAVKDVPPSQYITVKGNNPQNNLNNIPSNGMRGASRSLPRTILMDRYLQGSGWFSAEKVNGVFARWMTKLATVIIEPIDSSQPLQFEINGLTAVDLKLLNSIIIKINGNFIASTVQQQNNGSWICRGDIPSNLLPQEVAFLVTIEVAEVMKLSPQDSRKGSLLIESLLIKLKGNITF